MTSNTLRKYRAESAHNSIPLPYLPKTVALREAQKVKQPVNRDFDLRTNHSSLPAYDANKDKYLRSFFARTTVKKQLQQLPIQKTPGKTTSALKPRMYNLSEHAPMTDKNQKFVSK